MTRLSQPDHTSPRPFEFPVGTSGRATLLGVAAFLIVGFAVALCLTPDTRGFGTHQQLGLPPCSMKFMFGIPCPGCGMTTCFSHFVRGQLRAAARANPAGLVLATTCALLIPWTLVSAYRSRLCLISDPVTALFAVTISLSIIALGVWGIRMIALIL